MTAHTGDANSPLGPETEPAGYQFVKRRGRTLSPRVVIDPIEKTVSVKRKKSVESNDAYTQIKPRENNFAVFIDSENGVIPTMQTASKNWDSNMMVGKFRLDNLPIGALYRLSRYFGYAVPLYVRNLEGGGI